jgi:hypothetical protein
MLSLKGLFNTKEQGAPMRVAAGRWVCLNDRSFWG